MAAVIDDLRVPPEPVKKEGVKRAIPEVRRAASSSADASAAVLGRSAGIAAAKLSPKEEKLRREERALCWL